jgi:uncharacterized protein
MGVGALKTERVTFLSEGRRIKGILELPDGDAKTCVVASHGMQSSKESEKYIALCGRMAGEGMGCLRFDFTGCGESEGGPGEGTVTQRVADLAAAVAWVRNRGDVGEKIGLAGSSLGGYVSLLLAARDPGIGAVVTWATPFHLDDLPGKRNDEGYAAVGGAFFDDLPSHCLAPLLPRVSKALVIHGDADELVPPDHAREIFQALSGPKEIHIIEGGDHRLIDPDQRNRALDLTVAWFRTWLLSGG